jgi:hypothetical protein
MGECGALSKPSPVFSFWIAGSSPAMTDERIAGEGAPPKALSIGERVG